MIAQLEAVGHPHQTCLLPGQTHFYDAGATVISSVGKPDSLEQAISEFLARYL